MEKPIKEIREAVANYIKSEGCDCCRGSNHSLHKDILARILKVKKYSDGSGFDFGKYETKEKKKRRKEEKAARFRTSHNNRLPGSGRGFRPSAQTPGALLQTSTLGETLPQDRRQNGKLQQQKMSGL